MTAHSPHEVTRLLIDWRNGNQTALDQLMPLVYDELRRLADRYLRSERPGHTLQPTALVHEAYVHLVGMDVRWQDRVHFFAVAARLMRRILVDYAKQRRAAKRGGAGYKVSLAQVAASAEVPDTDLVALDEALNDLAALDSRQGQIIELHYFGGLTYEETAEVLGISSVTVHRELKLAKAWLYHEIKKRSTLMGKT